MLFAIKVKSLKDPLFYIHTLFVCSITFILCVSLSVVFIHQHNNQIKNNVKQWGNIIHANTKLFIKDNTVDFDAIDSILSSFELVDDVDFIYLYEWQGDELTILSSYRKNNVAIPINPSAKKIVFLGSPVLIEDTIKYIMPLRASNGIVIGYVYIQANLNTINNILTTLVLISLGTILLIFLLSLFLISKYHQSITVQIKSITTTIQWAARYKDYKATFNRAGYKEIDILSNALNIMLERMEKDIVNKSNSEQEVIRLNHELENKILSRTEALKNSNKELMTTLEKLHQFQEQLVENEKMASLGDMVAGMAHEINTPIGLGVTTSSLLKDKLNDIRENYDDKTLTGSQLKQFLVESDVNVNIIIRNLNRAAQLISSFKQVAVDQSNEEPRHFNVKQLIEEVFLTLGLQLNDKHYKISIECESSLYVNAKAGPISQILINLIMNSKIHGFNNTAEGEITITIMSLNNQLNIIYKDNGVGINSTLKSKVFEPFVTTKRGQGGSGLGLHLVYNLVTRVLGGSIQLESKLDKGVTFEINIPV